MERATSVSFLIRPEDADKNSNRFHFDAGNLKLLISFRGKVSPIRRARGLKVLGEGDEFHGVR